MTSQVRNPNDQINGRFVLHHWSLTRHWSFGLLVLLALSCRQAPTTQPAAPPAAEADPIRLVQPPPTNPPNPPGTARQPLRAYQVDVFLVMLPMGTLSGNEEFWKLIDEQCVDVATADLLYKNGLRVGLAGQSALEHLARYIEDTAPVERLAITGLEVKNAQILMKGELNEQTIFYFDRQNNVIGRSFDACENVMNVSFEPAPRKPGQLRLSLCPMVRVTKKRPEVRTQGEQVSVELVSPEVYYDLNCRADVPTDGFLIVTPSPDAARPSSVGNAFLIHNAPTQRLEQVLIIIPRPLRMGQNP